MFHGLGHDIRQAVRLASRAPGAAAAAALIVSLSLGPTLALVALCNALLLRPLAVVDEPERLVALSLIGPASRSANISEPAEAELARRQLSFTSICGFTTGVLFRVQQQDAVTQHPVSILGPGCASLLGIHAEFGRLIGPGDDPPAGQASVVVLSDAYWRRQFGADRAVLGQRLTIEGNALTIVGIAPPQFTGLDVESAPDVFVPAKYDRVAPADPKRPHGSRYVVGRLKPGVSIRAARAEIETLWPLVRDATEPPGLTMSQRETARMFRIDVTSLETGFSNLRRKYAAALTLVTGLAGAMLLVAAVNLAGLLLSQATSREAEFRVRLALGAGRPRLVRLLLIEILVPVLAGILAAVAAGAWLAHALVAMMWTSTVYDPALAMAPDWRVAAMAAALTIALIAIVALVPAVVLASSSRVPSTFRTTSRASGRWSRPLLVGQVALSLALVFGAGLLGRSARRLTHVDLGFQADGVVVTRLVPVPHGYDGLDAPTYYADMADRLRALPGVQAVAYSSVFPSPILSSDVAASSEAAPGTGEIAIAVETVSPGFFDAASVRLLDGRPFDGRDSAGATPVAIISRGLATELFPGANPIGRHVRVGHDVSGASFEIIGISGDPRLADIRKPPTPAIFRPYLQSATPFRQPIVIVRTAGNPAALVPAMRRTIESLGREYAGQPESVSRLIGDTILPERAMAGVAGACAVFVLVLAGIGLFALTTYRVRQRTREIGVRLALGASRGAVKWTVLRHALVPVSVGVLIGGPVALVAGRLVAAVLFDVSPVDPIILVGSAALFLMAGALAAWLPARRASTLDPLVALRTE